MSTKTINPKQVYLQDPLSAIPMLPANVEKKKDDRGLVQLRIEIPLKKWQKKIVDFLRYDYSKVIALDEMGSAFYDRVDGHASLRQIAQEMATLFNANIAEMEKAVMNFTKSLMERSALILKIEKENTIREASKL